MRLKKSLATLVLLATLTSSAYAGIMESPPVAPPDPVPTPAPVSEPVQNGTSSDNSADEDEASILDQIFELFAPYLP